MKKLLLKIILTVVIFFIPIFEIKGQIWHWAKSGVSSSVDEGTTSAVDIFGNVYITGTFSSPTVTFGTITLTNGGGACVFLTKYDSNGNVLWAKIGNCTSYLAEGLSISSDPLGNVFLVGHFFSPSVTFGPFTLVNQGGDLNMFIVKYDVNGNVLWAKSQSSSSKSDGLAVSTDFSGNAFVTGYFDTPTLTLGTYTLTNPGVCSNAFFAKYGLNGNVLWAKNAGGFCGSDGFSVCSDVSGNSFVTGTFSGTLTLGSYSLTSQYGDMFVAKFDANGNWLWAKSAGGLGDDGGNSICIDASGNVFVTGNFLSDTLNFGSDTLFNTTMGDFPKTGDIFLAKYDTQGNLLWAINPNGPSNEVAYSVGTYSAGVFVCGGFHSSPLTFSTVAISVPPGSTDPMFIVQYDLNGNAICASALTSGADDQNGLAVDKFGNAYVGGDFAIDPFVLGTQTLHLGGTGNVENAFIAKYSCTQTDVHELNKNLFFTIKSNPNNGSFKIQIDQNIANTELVICNSIGQIVYGQSVVQGENSIITKNFAQGLYYCTILQNKQQIGCSKLIIE